jgi:hypothetical protein
MLSRQPALPSDRRRQREAKLAHNDDKGTVSGDAKRAQNENKEQVSPRERRRLQQRLHRARARQGLGVYTVEISATLIDALITNGWLPEGAEGDRTAVSRAIERVLHDAAKDAGSD